MINHCITGFPILDKAKSFKLFWATASYLFSWKSGIWCQAVNLPQTTCSLDPQEPVRGEGQAANG